MESSKIFKAFINSCLIVSFFYSTGQGQKPLRLGLDGLSHGHVFWVFNHPDTTTFDLIGIAEPNQELAARLAKQYGFSMDLIYGSLEEMVESTSPEAVMAFNTTYDHLNTVQICAPKGIHVMVEKPLAVSMKHAKEMAELSRKHKIHLLTNYETTWYTSNQYVNQKLNVEGAIGKPRRMVVNDGHWGPQEIKVSKEFLRWLTDSKLNGGGAITDFGCYGANLLTWLKNGELPISVFATTSTFKPDIYKSVDDDATIILEYEETIGLIQASWNWPYSRKDIEVYGETGYVLAHDKNTISFLYDRRKPVLEEQLKPREHPYSNVFDYYQAVVQGDIKVNPNDLSSLENNLKVVQILDAAKRSAKKGKKVSIKNY